MLMKNRYRVRSYLVLHDKNSSGKTLSLRKLNSGRKNFNRVRSVMILIRSYKIIFNFTEMLYYKI